MTLGRIMIVDDNPTNLRLAQFTLESQGYEVLTARDGEQALALLGEARPGEAWPHVILMDIQLPGMDGLEVARKIRAEGKHPGLRIVALTAFAMKGDAERALAAGCDGYLAKPVMPDVLREVVAEHVALSTCTEAP